MNLVQAQRYLEKENKKWPIELEPIPKDQWPRESLILADQKPIEVWRSRTFLVQIYDLESNVRMSVLRTKLGNDKRYVDGITWDELQKLKRECGRGDHWAVEVFPPDADVINVANMRHIFFLPEKPSYAWGKP